MARKEIKKGGGLIDPNKAKEQIKAVENVQRGRPKTVNRVPLTTSIDPGYKKELKRIALNQDITFAALLDSIISDYLNK